MADINHLISLGIGSPAAISEFITFGLQIGEVVVIPPGNAVVMKPYIDQKIMYPLPNDRIMRPKK